MLVYYLNEYRFVVLFNFSACLQALGIYFSTDTCMTEKLETEVANSLHLTSY